MPERRRDVDDIGVLAVEVEQGGEMRHLEAVEDAVGDDDRAEVVRRGVDRGGANAIRGRAAADDHSVDLAVDQHPEQRRAKKALGLPFASTISPAAGATASWTGPSDPATHQPSVSGMPRLRR